MLAIAREDTDRKEPHEEQFDLVLRASDCTDSDYEDESDSVDEGLMETRDHLRGDETTTNQASGERDDCSSPVDTSLSSQLNTPLLKTIQGKTE